MFGKNHDLLFELLLKWLKSCDEAHSCRLRNEYWPTRVIFIGGSDPASVKLLETNSKFPQIQLDVRQTMSKPEQDEKNAHGYVALSHCWGNFDPEKKSQWCTTQNNYHKRLEGFKIGDLPKTFQDAIRVTRAIGRLFLWIDAICIIQEDQNDWESESQTMEKIFSSAYCTIAADAARNWEDGFLQRKSPPQYVEQMHGKDRMYTCDTTDDFEGHVVNSWLNRRAWVLQERVLSPRILHFAENHTYFACGENVRCENFTTLRR
jgi:hypothetical protein